MIDRGSKIEIPGKILTVNTKPYFSLCDGEWSYIATAKDEAQKLYNISYVVEVINKIKVVNWKKATIKKAV